VAFTFATVAEGPTDHAVLQNILLGLFKEHGVESGDISPVQPMLDETGKQLPDSPGGWLQVLRWLEQKKYDSALQYNDFVVVQIDTDTCEEVGYDIQKTFNGVARTPEELVGLVKAKLQHVIGPKDEAAYPSKFHFAIAVHGVECWLLPIWGRHQESDEIHNCKQRVDNGLGRANEAGLRKDDVRTYASASSDFRKKARLLEAAQSQKSLKLFCDSLQGIQVARPDVANG
jgi:hypothetical protein